MRCDPQKTIWPSAYPVLTSRRSAICPQTSARAKKLFEQGHSGQRVLPRTTPLCARVEARHSARWLLCHTVNRASRYRRRSPATSYRDAGRCYVEFGGEARSRRCEPTQARQRRGLPTVASTPEMPLMTMFILTPALLYESGIPLCGGSTYPFPKIFFF